MAADEFDTMSATLRFPFQASLDGSTMVETDGSLYYGRDTTHPCYEMQADAGVEADPKSKSQSENPLDSELERDPEGDSNKEQGPHNKEQPPVSVFPPRWDSLILSNQNSGVVTSRPISMLPRRIYTSDQQRLATKYEMAAEDTVEMDGVEEEKMMCESPAPTTTLEAPLQSEVPELQLPAPSSMPPRFYATPIVKDDPTSTPPGLYGLEQPSEHVPRPKKLVAQRRQRPPPAVTSSRPTSRHQLQPSPLSASTTQLASSEEQAPSTFTRRLSVILGRSSQYIPASPGPETQTVIRPTIGSISSSGSVSTTSTMRSVATTATESSNYTTSTSTSTPSSSTSSSPTLSAVPITEEKPTSESESPMPFTRADTLTGMEEKADIPTSQPSPPRPLRSNTTPIMNSITENSSSSGESSRRNSIFGMSRRKQSPTGGRLVKQNPQNPNTIRAVSNSASTTETVSSKNPSTDSIPLDATASRRMPFSPDSFESPHNQLYRVQSSYRTTPVSNDDNDFYNNDPTSRNSNTTTERPHTSYHNSLASGSSSTPDFSKLNSRYMRKESKDSTPTLSGKQKKANRATKFFSRIFV